jgi:hypothetical protein
MRDLIELLKVEQEPMNVEALRQTRPQTAELAQRFAEAYDSRAAKVALLRQRMHRLGKALAGEEVLAQKTGLKKFEYRS